MAELDIQINEFAGPNLAEKVKRSPTVKACLAINRSPK